MSALDLIVVRHGRTAWNADGRFQGLTDIPLDATGRAQAAGLARALASEHVDGIVTSNLSRARETAEAIAAPHGLEPQIDPQWRELHFGAWEGLVWREIVERFPEASERPNDGGAFVTPRGGESFADACNRVAEALAGLRAAWPAPATVVVATHAGVLHALLRVALGASEAQALGVRFVPASMTRLRFDDSGARVVALNVTADAEPLPS